MNDFTVPLTSASLSPFMSVRKNQAAHKGVRLGFFWSRCPYAVGPAVKRKPNLTPLFSPQKESPKITSNVEDGRYAWLTSQK